MTATDLKGSKKSIPRPEPTNGHSPFTKRHRVSEVRLQPAPVSFEYRGEPYEAIYNQAVINVQFGRLMRQTEDKTDAEHTVELLAALLLDWDLVQDDGETPLPCSVEELERQPNGYLGALFTAIFEDYSPPATPAADSESSF